MLLNPGDAVTLTVVEATDLREGDRLYGVEERRDFVLWKEPHDVDVPVVGHGPRYLNAAGRLIGVDWLVLIDADRRAALA